MCVRAYVCVFFSRSPQLAACVHCCTLCICLCAYATCVCVCVCVMPLVCVFAETSGGPQLPAWRNPKEHVIRPPTPTYDDWDATPVCVCACLCACVRCCVCVCALLVSHFYVCVFLPCLLLVCLPSLSCSYASVLLLLLLSLSPFSFLSRGLSVLSFSLRLSPSSVLPPFLRLFFLFSPSSSLSSPLSSSGWR